MMIKFLVNQTTKQQTFTSPIDFSKKFLLYYLRIMEQKNKRRFERVKINSEKIYDLSEGGIYIRTTEPRPLGSMIALELKLFENDQPVKVKGKVIRIVYPKGAPKKFPPGMAVQFIDLDEESREKIRKYIKSRKNLSGET